MILTVATMVVIRAETRQRLVLMLLTVGMACIAVADSGFAYLQNTGRYSSGNLIDLGWAAGFLLSSRLQVRPAGRPAPGGPFRSAARLGFGVVAVCALVLAALVAAAEPLTC